MTEKLKAPFVYFGGKSRVADVVWQRLGNVPHYVEPFLGSAAVLLARPHPPGTETVNDADCMIANFWRATQAVPHEVARWCDWPVNEADLHARHRWLLASDAAADFRKRMKADPDYFDARVAGWWVWGMSTAISREFLTGQGVRPSNSRPHLGDDGCGVNSPLRVNRLHDVFLALQQRLRRVRVCCGDWSRVCGSYVVNAWPIVGIFLDPPYADEAGRHMGLYATDSGTVAHDVRDYCLKHGGDPRYRIALAGYEGEHDELEQHGWRVHAWTPAGGLSNTGNARGKANRKRERIWFSPHCLHEPTLF